MFRALAPAIFLSLLTACASPSLKEEPSPEFAAEQLYPVRNSGFEEAHARRDANLPSYDVVQIEPMQLDNVEFTRMSVSGSVRRDWTITPDRERNLQQSWAGAMERAFADYDRSGEGERVLRISSELVRVRPLGVTTTASTVGGAPASGQMDATDISVEFRLYDQGSDELLAVIRDRRRIATLQWTRASGQDMGLLFNSWAALLQTRVAGR